MNKLSINSFATSNVSLFSTRISHLENLGIVENDILLVKSSLYNSQSSIDNPFSLFFFSVPIAPFEFIYLPLAAIATVSTNILNLSILSMICFYANIHKKN